MVNLSNFLRLSLAAFAVGVSSLPTVAKDFYVSQSAAGNGNAMSPENAASPGWFNSTENWGQSKEQIGPGDTVHLIGTITTALQVQASGAPGNPITILFDPGASMQSPVWPAETGAIDANSNAYITIDGGARGMIGGPTGTPGLANGFIENTANGTDLAFHSKSIFILVPEARHVTVRNLGLYNLYVRTSPVDITPASGPKKDWSAIVSVNSSGEHRSNLLVTNCVIHDALCGLLALYGPNCADFEYSHCTVYNCNWGGICGDSNRWASMMGLLVHDNYFHDFANWDDDTGVNFFHHDGFFAWAMSGGAMSRVRMYNNLVGPNFGMHTAGGLFIQGWVGDVAFYNNVLRENANDKAWDGLIYINPFPDIASTYSALNNTFVGGGVGMAIYYGPHVTPKHTLHLLQTINVENNLVLGVGTAVGLYGITEAAKLNIDFNLYHDLRSQRQFSYSTGDYSIFKGFSQWRKLGYDANGTDLDPKLGAGYVPGASSPALGAGANLSSFFTTDMAGAARPANGGWNIGAY